MNVWRVGHLQGQMVTFRIVSKFHRTSQLETIVVVPIVAGIIHVDGGGIVLKTTIGNGLLAGTDRPVVVNLIL